ncbi:MAG: sugar phosphate isomerase/epimerase family protein [Chthoniobacterales bacterium]
MESFKNLSVLGIIIGIETPESFARQLDMLLKVGYDYAYIADNMFSHVREKGDLPAIRDALKNSGMKVQSGHFKYLYPGPGHTMEGLKSEHLRDLDTAAELGLQCVTTHYLSITKMDTPGFLSDEILAGMRRNWVTGCEPLYHEAFAKLGGQEAFLEKNNELFRWLCDEAAQRNLTINIETGTCHLTKTPTQIQEYIRQIDRPNLGICLDSGHSHLFMGDVPGAIRQAGKMLVETHFHDNFADRDLHRPPGIGSIDWPEVICALRDIDFQGPVTFEVGDAAPHESYREQAEVYARNWREFLHVAAQRE